MTAESTDLSGQQSEVADQLFNLLTQTPVKSLSEAHRREAALALYELGNSYSFELLCEAATELDRSRLVREIAVQQLKLSTSLDCINAVCKYWFMSRSRDLEELIIEKQWVAEFPYWARVGSALLVGNCSDVESVEPDSVNLLAQLLHDSNPALAKGADLVLRALKLESAKERLCELITLTLDTKLISIAQASNYTPKNVLLKTRFLLLTDQIQLLSTVAPELVGESYLTAKASERFLLLDKIRQHMKSQLSEIMLWVSQNIEDLSTNEWELISASLGKEERFSEIWQVLKRASPLGAYHLLTELGRATCSPEYEGEKEAIQSLIADASKCNLTDNALLESDNLTSLVKYTYPPAQAMSVNVDRNIGVLIRGEANGNYIESESIEVHGVRDGIKLASIPFTKTVFCHAISPDGQWLAVGSASDGAIIDLWHLPSAEHVRSLPVYGWCVDCLAFDPTSSLLANGNYGKTIHIWDLQLLSLWRRFRVNFRAQSMSFNMSGDQLLVIEEGGEANVWQLPCGTSESVERKTGEFNQLRTWSDDDNVLKLLMLEEVGRGRSSALTCVSLHPYHSVAAFGLQSGSVLIYDFRKCETIKHLRPVNTGKHVSVQWIKFINQGDSLLVGRSDGVFEWLSRIGMITRKPLFETVPKDIDYLESIVLKNCTDTETSWRHFLSNLLKWQHQYAVGITESSFVFPNTTDIEIEW